MFPENRPRRLRSSETIRRLVKETRISPDNLIYPLFIKEGRSLKEPIISMPDQFRYSPDMAATAAKDIFDKNIPAVLLFGIPSHKDKFGTEAHKSNGVVQKAIAEIKNRVPEMLIITDVCMCEYTDHGHCGILDDNGQVSNDETLELLAKISLSHVKAGASMVAPSDMMDGRIGFIREALDESGYEDIPIMSYSAKYASAFYGPFREAAGSTPSFGNRKAYQMDPANAREAIREVQLDVEEGADIIMVKPAMPCLDIIKSVADEFNEPLAAYQVSGEYAMIKAAAGQGWLDDESCMMESIIAIRRAGADMIITYFAPQIARLIS